MPANHKIGEPDQALSVAVIYSPRATHVGTVQDHLEALASDSRVAVTYVPGTTPSGNPPAEVFSHAPLDLFEVVVVHYSVRVCLDHHLRPEFRAELSSFLGLKILFIQDEYENTNTTRKFIAEVGFDLVFSCVPEKYIEAVYPPDLFPGTEFLTTLTGFAQEPDTYRDLWTPYDKRDFDIVYRGRPLGGRYGDLGKQKSLIGSETEKRAGEFSLRVNISSRTEDRIYGKDWLHFLSSGIATLGTESGSNVFQDLGYQDSDNPPKVRMNQISPKLFEAIQVRTLLVLFEGSYSGILEPWRHYFPLQHDFSNFADAVDLIRSQQEVQAMTERAYSEIIASRRYSYAAFAKKLWDVVIPRVRRSRGKSLVVAALSDAASTGTNSPALIIPVQWPLSLPLVPEAPDWGHLVAQYNKMDLPAGTRRPAIAAPRVVKWGFRLFKPVLKRLLLARPGLSKFLSELFLVLHLTISDARKRGW